MMNADLIGDPTLTNGNNCTTHDRHDEDARSVSGERSKFRFALGVDAREHDGVKKAD